MISGTPGTDLPAGDVTDLVSDPGDAARLYTALVNGVGPGIYTSTDTGQTWTDITDGAMAAVIDGTTNNIEMAVHDSVGNNAIYVGIMNDGQMAGMFRSDDYGATWTPMDIPQTNEDGTWVGIQPRVHPGSQGEKHFSIVADPLDPDVVYVGGDRQPESDGDTGGWPNSIGAEDYSGRLFRGDASEAPGSQWIALTHDPSTDNRLDGDGDTFEGGNYVRFINIDDTPPTVSGFSVNGGLAQRSHINSLAMTFAENVWASLDPADLSLQNITTPQSFSLTGDANGDRSVNRDDYLIMIEQFGSSGSDLAGDLNGSDRVDLMDFATLIATYGNTLAPPPAPLPAPEAPASAPLTQAAAETSIDILAESAVADDEGASVRREDLVAGIPVLSFRIGLSDPAGGYADMLGSEATDHTATTPYRVATAEYDLRPLRDDLPTDGEDDLLADILAESPLAVPL